MGYGGLRSSKKSKYKTHDIPLQSWYRILVSDFPSWPRQIQIDLPYILRARQTANKMFISGWSRQIQIDLPYIFRARQTANKMFISGLV